MSETLSSLIAKDLQSNFLQTEKTSGLNDVAMIWQERQFAVLDALLPIALFTEALGIPVAADDFTTVSKLRTLISQLQESHRFAGSAACRRAVQMLINLPDYKNSRGATQSGICEHHYGFMLMPSRNLVHAAGAFQSTPVAA